MIVGRRWRVQVGFLVLACGGNPEAAPETHATADSGAPPISTCPVPGPSGSSGSAPSFAGDVFPLLNQSCGTFACHNSAFRNRGLFLGESLDEGTPDEASRAAAYETLLAQSVTAPALRRVSPGEPSRSFLMLKLDGCHASLGLDCPNSPAERPCGDRMPPTVALWAEAKREMIRRWIAEGATGP